MELPVSSQQTMQSALLGTMLATRGFDVLSVRSKASQGFAASPRECREKAAHISAFLLRGISWIALLLYPIPGSLAQSLLIQVIYHLVTPEAWEVIVAVTLATVVAALLSLIVVVPLTRKRLEADEKAYISKCSKSRKPSSDLNHVYEEDEGSWASPAAVPESHQVSPLSSVTTQLIPLKQLLGSKPNRLAQKRDFQRIEKSATGRNRNFSRVFTDQKTFTFFPKVIEYDRKTLVRHALAEKFEPKMEDLFRFPHLLAVSIYMYVQSANEIAALASPFEAITDVLHHRNRYSGKMVKICGKANSLSHCILGKRAKEEAQKVLIHCSLCYIFSSRDGQIRSGKLRWWREGSVCIAEEILALKKGKKLVSPEESNGKLLVERNGYQIDKGLTTFDTM
ncbi:uncharacterized protein [Aristolochia californica]|uniref:uncharacterized protein n=1 Tax=Aristolochia californica TaxID=171875 RepID=UPI0035DB7911